MNQSEQVGTGAHRFGDWISTEEAVAYCHAKGLSRTLKTIRKWAKRGYENSREGEITVRKQDTANKFRWLIQRTSLDIKIGQEKDIDARRAAGSSQSDAPTGGDRSEPVPTGSSQENGVGADANRSKPVPTGGDSQKELINALKAEVGFLRDELKHRRTTDEALQNVITAVGTNAKAQLLQAENKKRELDRQEGEARDRTMRIFAEGREQPQPGQQVDNQGEQDSENAVE